MKKISIQTLTFIFGAFILASCSTNKMALNGTQDNLYFMASDAKVATEFAVQNNNPKQFESLATIEPEAYSQENFSSRNVNPDYIAKYQTETVDGDEGTVYFDEAGTDGQSSQGDIDAYNNFRVGGSAFNSGFNSGFNQAMSFNMGMMYGFGMMNPWMNPWMSPFGMGGFYDPFWGPGLGFRPGFNLSLGFGFGNFGRFNPFWGPNFGMGLGMGWGSPFFGGYPGWGYPVYAGRPIFVLPGGEFGDRRVVRAARPTRGSSLITTGRPAANAAIQPNTARAQARRDVLNNGGSRSLVNGNNARTSSRDFGTSQNDYYSNTRSRLSAGSTRNVGSPAMDRSVSRTRSAMPSARPSAIPSNSRVYTGPSRSGVSRSANPAYNNRATSPSYRRSTSPSRSGFPSYNSGGTNSRTYSTPSRSSSIPSYSAPSRSSSGGMSSGGGASRSSGGGSSSGGSRGGRGN